jgi:hypothetical protein
MTQADPEQALAFAAEAAAEAERAEELREELRWSVKPGDPEREERLAAQLSALDEVMRPVRSVLGRLAWSPLPEKADRALRSASAEVQYQRKQLKKMRR